MPMVNVSEKTLERLKMVRDREELKSLDSTINYLSEPAPYSYKTKIKSRGIWPDYLFNDLNPARNTLQMKGALIDHCLLCSHEVYDCLLEKMPDKDITYENYLINNHIVKKIIPWTTNKDSAVLMYYAIDYDELDVNLLKIFVEITGVKIRPLKNGETIKELQALFDSGDYEKFADGAWEVWGIHERYSRKTYEYLINNLKLTSEQYSLIEQNIAEINK